MVIKKSKGEKVFNVFNIILLSILAICTIYPLIYVVAASLSSPGAINSGQVWLCPKDFTFEAYRTVCGKSGVWIAYINSIFYMVVGTAVQMIVTICGAYPLSRKGLPGSRLINFFVIVTMWFTAGTIPMYINFKELGLLNNRWGYIIGFACGTYNFVLLRTFFASVPEALEESAKLEGASDLYILLKIFIPLSLPSLATVTLFYAVDRWNGYFWAMILLRDENKIPLQVLLKNLVVEMSGKAALGDANVDMSSVKTSAENVTYATIVITVLPMIVIYPFIQKYFVKGAMIGAVKG